MVLASLALVTHARAQHVAHTSAPRSGGFFVQFGDVAPSADAKPGLIPAPSTPVPTARTLGLAPAVMPAGLVQYRQDAVPASVGPEIVGLSADTLLPAAAANSARAVTDAKRSGPRIIVRPKSSPGGTAPAVFRGVNQLNDPWQGSVVVPGCDEEGILCDDCEMPCPCPCPCIWQHCTSIRASALYMRPRDADIAYAVPIDGPISALLDNPIQIGPVGVVDPDYETGFDVGVSWAVNCLTSITADYRYLESTTSGQIATDAPFVIRSLVAHPSTTTAAADFLVARADAYLKMQVIDLGIRHLFVGGDVFAVNYFVGGRAGRIEQTFDSLFENNGTERVSTDFDFDGAGLRLGLEAERYSCHSCLRGYGRAHASFLAGRFEGRYLQQQSFDPTVVDTGWEAGRVVPILDLELGVGWTSKSGCFKINVGYMFSSWFNMVKTEDFINAVHVNDFNDLDNVLSFDGLVGQAELRF